MLRLRKTDGWDVQTVRLLCRAAGCTENTEMPRYPIQMGKRKINVTVHRVSVYRSNPAARWSRQRAVIYTYMNILVVITEVFSEKGKPSDMGRGFDYLKTENHVILRRKMKLFNCHIRNF